MPPDTPASLNLVDVVVAVDGTPEKLLIRPAAMRLSPERLAEVILAALRDAYRDSLQRLLTRFEDLQLDPHTPGVRRTRELAQQIQADMTRQAEQVRADLDALRRKLSDLSGT